MRYLDRLGLMPDLEALVALWFGRLWVHNVYW